MPQKVEIPDELHDALKAEAILRGKKLKELVAGILQTGISKETKEFWDKKDQKSKKNPISKATITTKTTDTELTVKLLSELQRLLSEGLEPTNKELVANIPEIKHAGPILKQHGVNPKHKNRARRYTVDLIPIVEKAIEDFKRKDGRAKF